MCAICTLLDELSEEQREMIRGTVWGSVLKYKKFAMDRFLVQALIQAWNPDSSTFMIGGREVQFSHYDIALVTGREVVFTRGDSGGEVSVLVYFVVTPLDVKFSSFSYLVSCWVNCVHV